MKKLISFKFCDVDAVEDLGLIVNDIKAPVTPEITESMQDIPGMVGNLFLGNSYGQKVYNIDVTIPANSATERTVKLQQLAELVMTFGSGEYPMEFSNDPGYTYYGHFSDISQPSRIIQTKSWTTCTLTFTCSDPKGYGDYVANDILVNPITVVPDGNDECYPVFTCIPKKDVTKIAVTDEDGNYIFLGTDVDPDTGDTPVDKEPMVLHDACNTLATWTAVSTDTLTWELENGVIAGKMASSPNAILPDNMGNPVSKKWHGPVRIQWLPGSYNDYRVLVRMINQQSYNRAQGKIELYLLDSTGGRIGKIMLKDNGTESKLVYASLQVQAGSRQRSLYFGPGTIKKGATKTIKVKVGNGTKKVKSKSTTKTVQQWKTVTLDEDLDTGTFTNFYGYLRLEKIGNKFAIEIMKLDSDTSNPVWKKPVTATWTDTENAYNKDLAGVALYIAKYDIYEDNTTPITKYKNNDMRLCDLKVWNILDGGEKSVVSKPTVIARKGDEIKLNCEDRTVYKNGNYFMNKLYIGSDFPTMRGGIPTTFAFEPSLTDADWYVEYRPTTK